MLTGRLHSQRLLVDPSTPDLVSARAHAANRYGRPSANSVHVQFLSFSGPHSRQTHGEAWSSVRSSANCCVKAVSSPRALQVEPSWHHGTPQMWPPEASNRYLSLNTALRWCTIHCPRACVHAVSRILDLMDADCPSEICLTCRSSVRWFPKGVLHAWGSPACRPSTATHHKQQQAHAPCGRTQPHTCPMPALLAPPAACVCS